MKLITATGREINVYNVVKGGMIDYLHIYNTELSISQIYEIFSDPNETVALTIVYEVDGQEVRKTYRMYTELYSVQKPFLDCPPGTNMIWLQRPEINYDEEEVS